MPKGESLFLLEEYVCLTRIGVVIYITHPVTVPHLLDNTTPSIITVSTIVKLVTLNQRPNRILRMLNANGCYKRKGVGNMVRPLRGQQEVFRRLNERNEARRVRTNEVRELGGLEPLPEPQGSYPGYAEAARQMENELQNYLSGYVGTPNRPYYQRQLLEGLQSGTVNLIAGRSSGRTSAYEYARRVADGNIRGRGSQHIWFDTEAGLPQGRITEMYGVSNPANEIYQSHDVDWWDKMAENSPQWAWLTGKMTYEEYQRQDKINDLKKQKKISNRDAKFVLEKEY